MIWFSVWIGLRLYRVIFTEVDGKVLVRIEGKGEYGQR